MDKMIKITASDPVKDLDEHVVNLFIKRASQKRLGTLWLDSEIDALQISRAITALPEILEALEFHQQVMDQTPSASAERSQQLLLEMNKRLSDAYNKATQRTDS